MNDYVVGGNLFWLDLIFFCVEQIFVLLLGRHRWHEMMIIIVIVREMFVLN